MYRKGFFHCCCHERGIEVLDVPQAIAIFEDPGTFGDRLELFVSLWFVSVIRRLIRLAGFGMFHWEEIKEIRPVTGAVTG